MFQIEVIILANCIAENTDAESVKIKHWLPVEN